MHDGAVAQKPTVFDLDKLIERCLDEAVRVGYIELDGSRKVIVNEIELCKHIAKTIIGELYEFEVIRKVSPMFRMLRQLEVDFAYFDARQLQENQMLGLRIDPDAR